MADIWSAILIDMERRYVGETHVFLQNGKNKSITI